MRDEELISLARGGSRLATEHLLVKYRALVEGKARVYYLVGADREDVVQEGMIGLFKAIRDYSDRHLAAFCSFAELCITRQIITALKTATRQKHQLFNSCVSLDNGPEWGPEDGLGEAVEDPTGLDPERLALVRDCCRQVWGQIWELLSEFEARALVGHLRGHSYEHLSRDLGCQAKQIDNALQRAKRKLVANLTPD